MHLFDFWHWRRLGSVVPDGAGPLVWPGALSWVPGITVGNAQGDPTDKTNGDEQLFLFYLGLDGADGRER